MKLRSFLFAALLASIVTSSGCLYRADILQGNRIDRSIIEQLELGMTSKQVQFLLGEPAITDLHHPDQWHYVFYIRSGEDHSEQKRIMTLKFKDDLLTEIKGDRNLTSQPSV